jgi:hypothetical protein
MTGRMRIAPAAQHETTGALSAARGARPPFREMLALPPSVSMVASPPDALVRTS